MEKELKSNYFPYSKEEAIATAQLGIEWLCRAVKQDGKFVYQYHIHDKGLNEYKQYNILRHAGCVWAMFYALNYMEMEWSKRKILSSRAWIALKELIVNNICLLGKGKNEFYCLQDKGFLKIGSLGLGILALLEAYKNSRRVTKVFNNPKLYEEYIKLVTNLSELLLYLQQEDGSFPFHKYDLASRVESSFKSKFYDGECALALVRLWKDLKIIKYKEAAEKLIKWKFEKKQKEGHIRDHWMLQAIDELTKNLDINYKDYPMYIEYASAIAEKILNDPYDLYRGDIFGSLACRSEALISYLKIINYKEGATNHTKEQVHAKLNEYLRIQIVGQIKYGLSTGAWVTNLYDSIVRCDFAQHNSMAFLRYSLLKL